jgi:hypothetical protein
LETKVKIEIKTGCYEMGEETSHNYWIKSISQKCETAGLDGWNETMRKILRMFY